MDPITKVLLGLLAASKLMGGGHSADHAAASYVRTGNVAPIAVAVVPMVNLSGDEQADRKIMGPLVTHLLASKGFLVTEPTVVETALADLRARGQLDLSQTRLASEKLGVRLLLMGSITEFGESAGAGALTVSVDARLVDAVSAQIVWAGSVSKSARDSESLLGGGKAPSLSKLVQDVVAELVKSLVKGRADIGAYLAAAPGITPTTTTIATPPTGTAHPTDAGPGTEPSPAKPLYQDEERALSVDDLKALLPTIETVERSNAIAKDHPTKLVSVYYRTADSEVRVELADYEKADIAQAVVQSRSAGAEQKSFDEQPAFSPSSEFGYFHLNISVGRFGLYLRAPAEQEETLRKIALTIVKNLKK
jgi:hypothetical protein